MSLMRSLSYVRMAIMKSCYIKRLRNVWSMSTIQCCVSPNYSKFSHFSSVSTWIRLCFRFKEVCVWVGINIHVIIWLNFSLSVQVLFFNYSHRTANCECRCFVLRTDFSYINYTNTTRAKKVKFKALSRLSVVPHTIHWRPWSSSKFFCSAAKKKSLHCYFSTPWI